MAFAHSVKFVEVQFSSLPIKKEEKEEEVASLLCNNLLNEIIASLVDFPKPVIIICY